MVPRSELEGGGGWHPSRGTARSRRSRPPSSDFGWSRPCDRSRFPLIVAALNALSARSCVIDGEAIVCDDKGLSVFDLVRYRSYDHVASLCAFDLLELNGQDMRDRPLEERKAALRMLLRRRTPALPTIGTSMSRAQSCSTTPASLAAKASCRSGLARYIGLADRQTGSRSRIRAGPAAKREAEEEWR
jgi:hypothetical protein